MWQCSVQRESDALHTWPGCRPSKCKCHCCSSSATTAVSKMASLQSKVPDSGVLSGDAGPRKSRASIPCPQRQRQANPLPNHLMLQLRVSCHCSVRSITPHQYDYCGDREEATASGIDFKCLSVGVMREYLAKDLSRGDFSVCPSGLTHTHTLIQQHCCWHWCSPSRFVLFRLSFSS